MGAGDDTTGWETGSGWGGSGVGVDAEGGVDSGAGECVGAGGEDVTVGEGAATSWATTGAGETVTGDWAIGAAAEAGGGK